MNGFAVSDRLKTNYDNYYDDGESEWRRLGAIDKVNNIANLCENYPHSDTLEIGSGGAMARTRLQMWWLAMATLAAPWPQMECI